MNSIKKSVRTNLLTGHNKLPKLSFSLVRLVHISSGYIKTRTEYKHTKEKFGCVYLNTNGMAITKLFSNKKDALSDFKTRIVKE